METWKILLAIAAAVVAFLCHGGDSPRTIGPLNPDDPEQLPSGVTKRVLIIGGGIAGLSAGLELSEKGYNVTIKEKNSVLGGRLMTEEIDVAGQVFHVEHGFHGWFHNYHNLKDIRARLGVNKYFYPWLENYFMYREYETEEIHSEGPFPFNLFRLAIKSPNISIWKLLVNPYMAIANLFYNYDTVYDNYDNMTFSEWEDYYGVDKTFSDVLLRPALSASFNEAPVFSAAEMLTYSHIYFISNSQADHREITNVDHGTALINPWAERIKELGGKVLTSSPVEGLYVNESSGMVTGEISGDSTQYDHVILATDLPATQKILAFSVDASRNLDTHVAAAINKLSSDVAKLPLAPPYKVIRVWFDKQIRVGPSYGIIQTPQHHPINLIAQYSLLERESIDWAERTGGSVFEFHSYNWLREDVPDSEVWEVIAPTVGEIYPEIIEKEFKIVAYHVYSSHNFASFASGLERLRPSSDHPKKCGIPNLSLAGDWLHTDYPSALMERAVSTGREAANHILLVDHVKQVPLVVTGSRGPGII